MDLKLPWQITIKVSKPLLYAFIGANTSQTAQVRRAPSNHNRHTNCTYYT